MLGVAELDPGAAHGVHRHRGCEQCVYVLDGAGEHLGLEEAVELSTGQASFAATGTWHGFASSAVGRTRLLTLWGGVTDLSAAGFELPTGEADVDAQHAVHPTALGHERRADSALDVEAGFDGLDVYWIVTSESCAASSLLLGTSTFQPGGLHELHRHPNAEEFLLIVDGGGYHRTADGEEHLGPNQVALIDRGEWHGFRADPDAPTHTLFGYLGAASLRAAGYEVLG
jgi:quercetin dioxygenase-like cupin family protein